MWRTSATAPSARPRSSGPALSSKMLSTATAGRAGRGSSAVSPRKRFCPVRSTLDPRGHLPVGRPEPPEFVAARQFARRDDAVARGDLPRIRGDPPERAGEAVEKGEPDEHGGEDERAADPEQWNVNEEEAAAAVGVGGEKQRDRERGIAGGAVEVDAGPVKTGLARHLRISHGSAHRCAAGGGSRVRTEAAAAAGVVLVDDALTSTWERGEVAR